MLYYLLHVVFQNPQSWALVKRQNDWRVSRRDPKRQKSVIRPAYETKTVGTDKMKYIIKSKQCRH